MAIDNHINYIELKARDLSLTKTFYQNTFDWTFVDYGPNYCSFNGAGLDGGFEKTDETIVNGALVVLFHNDLPLIQQKIIENGGEINIETFNFPGGKRFHFIDPSGNELSVWRPSDSDNQK